MHYDEDDEEYSDLDLDFEDAVERGYEDDKDRDDDRFKFGFEGFSRSGGSGPGAGSGSGCLVILGVLGASLGTLAATFLI